MKLVPPNMDMVHQGGEGWVPHHVLHPVCEAGRKPWSFRFRKPSFSGGRRGERRSFDGGNVSPQGSYGGKQGLILEYPASGPEFLERLSDVSAAAGTTAELR